MVGGKTSYQYVKLSEAKEERTCKSYNVFGVVTFSKVPKKTQGTDYCMTVSIADESLLPGEKIVCMLFYRQLDSFPKVSVGDVVRFHRLVVEDFHGEPKGKPGHGFAWLVISNDTDKPQASSQYFTYTDENKKRVQELQVWARTQGFVAPLPVTIDTLTPRLYCDLVCQVIGTCVEEDGVCFVARVWDGTRPLHPTVNTLNRPEQVDTELDQVTSEMSVDIWLFDDHFQSCLRMKPGQFIKLCNLHAVVHKDSGADNADDDVAFPTLELTIHRGTSYGRGVVFLDPDAPEVAVLKQRIAALPRPAEKDSRSPNQRHVREWTSAVADQTGEAEPQPGCSNDNVPSQQRTSINNSTHSKPRDEEMPLSNSELQGVQYVSGAASSGNGSVLARGGDAAVSQPILTEECMLQTASVVIGHQHISRMPLSQVLSHSVPYKFRVLANVVDFHPNTDDASEFVQLLCPKCFQLNTAKKSTGDAAVAKSQSSTSLASRLAKFLGGGFANWNPEQAPQNTEPECICPQCSTDNDPVELEPVYMLRLILQDSSGHLVANLWRKEAVTFFRGVKAEDMLKDKGVFTDIMSTLRGLCLSQASSSSASPPPKLDCCLHSYTAQSGVNYHIFDTELV